MMNTVASMVPPADNQAALAAMTEQGLEEAEEEASDAEQDTIVGQVVSTLIESRLKTFIHTGLCRRNYTAHCPNGWTMAGMPEKKEEDEKEPQIPMDGSVQCSAEEVDPENSDPGCASYNVTDAMSPVAKEAFALKCKVQWPCAACKRDFSRCPEDFDADQERVGVCKPKPTYVGPCPEAVDFSKTSDTVLKARWAARCYSSWPCIKD
jgi:CPW-WPC domain-containing protein